MKRPLRIFLFVLGCVFVLAVAAAELIYLQVATLHNEGSPELAERWRVLLTPANPDNVDLTQNPGMVVLRFPNGEWVVGISQDSHGFYPSGGGTMVIKDSKGNVRAFFGHVCGSRNLDGGLSGTKIHNLDQFYQRVGEARFVEHEFAD